MVTRYFPLLVLLLLVVTASFVSTSFEAGEWFHVTMDQPAMTPPYWLFGPVWALVYVFMALAAWNVWLTGRDSRNGALVWWILLLVLSIAWSALFFGLNRPGWAMPVLGLTLGVAVLCLRAFSLVSRQAAYLMLPYLCWVAYLLVLNLAIWTRNGGFLQGMLG